MADEPGGRGGAPAVLAVSLFALVIAELMTAVAGALAGGISLAAAISSFMATNGAMGAAFALSGLLLAWHRPRNPIGWLFLAAAAGEATSAAAVQLLGLGSADGWPAVFLRLLASLFMLGWPLAVGLCLPTALLLFPDGHPVSARWRWLIWAAAAESLLFELSAAGPGKVTFGAHAVTPLFAIPFYDRLGTVWAASSPAWAAIVALAVASLAVRYRRGSDVERRQLLWLVLTGLAALAYAGVSWGIFGTGPVLGLLVIALIPTAVTVAILRYRLLDIRLVVSRTLVYGLLTGAAAASYVGLVTLLDVLVRSRVSLGSAVVASVIVAIGFNPARIRLQRLIDRMMYGDRHDPVRAVSLIGERLTGLGAAGLSGVMEALCGSLRLPFAAVRIGSAQAAAYGTVPELVHSVALRYEGASIGELIVGLRSGQRRLSQPDIAVLDLLADPLAVALHAMALSAALQESRVGIVEAREEERRRLRRDLHDGLGPALAGIAFKAEAARHELLAEPAYAGDLLGELRADSTAAIADIRRLVDGLRPSALDDLGLIGSLRQQSASLTPRSNGSGIAVVVDTSGSLPPLSAAVEVAAYRIITEAMTNAARHSGATKIDVKLALTDGQGLRIEVRDDGAGLGPGWLPGFGLISMRERAAELGGSCRAGPDPGCGGLVVAELPLGDRAGKPSAR
jgi:two-component system, NarL family, sensor kinase